MRTGAPHCRRLRAPLESRPRGIVGVPVKRLMRAAVVLALVMASSSAAALGLGQIQLKSKLGEPLLAEIPIVSSDPSELENLRAGLASPETFARIGLQRPQGVVADLQFVPALDSAGRPVIRVTSAVPIDEPLLTFLVEVDWGQGRLVREYSTLLDAPRTLAASAQPQILAPQQAPSNMIVRDPVAPVPAASYPGSDGGSGATAAAGDNTPSAGLQVPSPVSAPTQYGAVQRGERLSSIAAGLDMGGNLEQRMIALLQANPQAFIDGNVHLLKQGAVLRVPDAAAVAGIAASRAAAQVREQTRAWRVASQPVPQPEVAGSAPAVTQPSATAAVAPAAASAGARLEIVPPGASDASRAGTQSGISAGGEGDMVRQELQVTKETLAARDAELAELKTRIDTLEQLQADQQKLLSMKDSDLAAAQQQLAQSQSAAPPVVTSATPWLLGGSALVLVLIGAWWMRRRAGTAPRFRAPVSPDASALNLAAGFPAAATGPGPATDAGVLNPESMHGGATGQVDPAASPTAVAALAETAEAREPSGATMPPVPAWHAGSDKQRLHKISSAPITRTAAASASEAEAASRDASLAEVPRIPPPPPGDTGRALSDADAPGMDRLELARAYLDLGDQESARQLLGELVVTGGLEARQQATRLLREMG